MQISFIIIIKLFIIPHLILLNSVHLIGCHYNFPYREGVPFLETENFTVLIKNSVQFPKFNKSEYVCIFKATSTPNAFMEYSPLIYQNKLENTLNACCNLYFF